jgi:2-aminoadipate transaminase
MLPRPELDPQSADPLYRQLYRHIRQAIQSGRLVKGDRLPATRELAGMLGLNRATVSAAYELLESEGLVKAHVGRGSFVDSDQLFPLPNLNWQELLHNSERRLAGNPTAMAASGEMISFATSRPSERLFPMEEFRANCQEVLASRQARAILQLGSPNGYAPLRRYLLDEARIADVASPDDDVIITNGCQQALDLLQRVLISPGDTVLLEDPVYPGLHHAFARAGARLVGVPVGSGGLDIARLEQLLGHEHPKMLVVTPNFQNPTGETLPLAARSAVLRLAKQAGTIVVENDIYGDLRYHGQSLATLKQLDQSGDVVLLRSFSKVAFPGLRVGWAIGPRPLIDRLAEAKQWCDLHTDQLSQAVLLHFVETGRLEQHRKKVITAGAERVAATVAACAEFLPAGTRFTRPQGGMNLWVELPEPLDAGELLPRAQAENVTYLPGKYFAVSRPQSGSLRLSFAGLPPEKIRKGVVTLGRLFQMELERVREASCFDPAPAMV